MNDKNEQEERLALMEQEYGQRVDWNTDHLQHFNRLMQLISEESTEEMQQRAEVLDSVHPQLNFIRDYFQGIIARLKDADGLSDEDKCFILQTLYEDYETRMDREAKLTTETYGYLASQFKKVGRPARSKFIFDWLDYLRFELGSINKSLKYFSEHPIASVLVKNIDTLKRDYRKYRNDEQNKERGG